MQAGGKMQLGDARWPGVFVLIYRNGKKFYSTFQFAVLLYLFSVNKFSPLLVAMSTNLGILALIKDASDLLNVIGRQQTRTHCGQA